jgi:alpha-ketoglutarate-dependent taurine dioxygenase
LTHDDEFLETKVTMNYERIEVGPLAGAIGAEISGVDLSRPLDNRTTAEILAGYIPASGVNR